MLNFGFKREGFFLVGTNHLCFCFVGSEWSIDGPYEGRHQAQSHADIRGEQTAYLVPLRPKGRNSRLFLTEADFGSLCSPDTYFTRPDPNVFELSLNTTGPLL